MYVERGDSSPVFAWRRAGEKKTAGTENVAGIVGLGKAAEIAVSEMAEEEAKIRALRDRLEQGVRETYLRLLSTDTLNNDSLIP